MARNRNKWKELGERVAQARNASHLNQQDLATRIGIDRTALTKIESGNRGLDALELARIAQVLKRPIDWFVSRPPQNVAARRNKRKKQLVDDSPADLALEDIARDVGLLQELGFLLEGEPFKLKRKVKTAEDARVVAEDFRKYSGMGQEPVWNLQHAAESAGLHAFSIDLEDDNLDGSCLAVGNGGVALINGKAPPGRRRFTLAHELGHHLFQDPYSAEWVVDLSSRSSEKVINIFAIHFLLPGRVAKKRWSELADQFETREAAIQTAAEFGLSWTALCAHLRNLGLVGPNELRQLEINPPRRHDYLELGVSVRDDLTPPSVPPRFAQAVIRAFRGHKISGARAIEMLRGTIEENELPEQVTPPLEALRAEIESGSA